jgi:hypothetical protein
MHKKTDMKDLDIPLDDIECWGRYPKHRWVYELTRLLDAQGIKWSLLPGNTLKSRIPAVNIDQVSALDAGYIYTKVKDGKLRNTEVFISKGEIKHMYHIDSAGSLLSALEGDTELRISAFVTMHFAKFTGIISCVTYGPDIYSVRLRSIIDLSTISDQEVVRLIKRIYKKTDITLNGLTDQVFRESIAS